MAKVLYRANAHVTGGRGGHGRTDDGELDVNLRLPKEMGGEGGGTIVAQGPPEVVASEPRSYTGQFLARYYESAGNLDAGKHLPPIELPDYEKKPPKPKFIKPEKKTGVPTPSKTKPESSAQKKLTATAAKKAAKKSAKSKH